MSASHYSGFFCCRAWALGHAGLVAVVHRLLLWLLGSGAQSQWLWGTGLTAPQHVYLSGPGTEPVSPVLAGRFFTTETPVVVQSLSHVRLVATSWTAACQASLSFTISQSLLKFMFIESVMPSKHLVLCHPLLLPSIFPSIRVFSNESSHQGSPLLLFKSLFHLFLL